jgi:hypothetical protein
VKVLDHAPGRDAVDVGRVKVFADMNRIDDNWAIEALAVQSCRLGANALVLLDEQEATPPHLARSSQANYVAFEGQAFKLR